MPRFGDVSKYSKLLREIEVHVPMDQMVLGRLRLDVNVIVEVLPADTVTLPVPASSSPWYRVTVYVPGFIMFLVKDPLKVKSVSSRSRLV